MVYESNTPQTTTQHDEKHKNSKKQWAISSGAVNSRSSSPNSQKRSMICHLLLKPFQLDNPVYASRNQQRIIYL